ncbi:unnamed protein product, partial [Discosporangium mesarthrocarpum]
KPLYNVFGYVEQGPAPACDTGDLGRDIRCGGGVGGSGAGGRWEHLEEIDAESCNTVSSSSPPPPPPQSWEEEKEGKGVRVRVRCRGAGEGRDSKSRIKRPVSPTASDGAPTAAPEPVMASGSRGDCQG